MLEEFQEQQRKKLTRARSIMDITMGVIFFFGGIFFIIYRQFGIRLMNREPSNIDYMIGGLFIFFIIQG